ncbi:MAG: DUF4347 domain-containing protein [Rhodospirillales bacterium]|nr:DUF4347 domain-containing protein [Rhodospirillales bacterium]
MGLFAKSNNSRQQGGQSAQASLAHPAQPMALALEPRFMFDAAGAATGAEVAEQAAADSIADAPAHSESPPESRRELVVVDTSVAGYLTLIEGLAPGAEVLEIGAQENGFQSLADALAGRPSYDAIHIVSHGGEGEVKLGASLLTSDSLADYDSALSALGAALTADGDLLLYGCEVGTGVGRAFIDDLSIQTGADVAASDDLTGAADKGGDWDLEVVSGSVEAATPFSARAMADFTGVLAVPADNTTFTMATAAGWTDGGATLTHNYFSATATDSGGVKPLNISGTVAYISGGATNSAGNFFTITADGTNVGTFQLTTVVAGDYRASGNFSSVYIKGYVSGGGTVQTSAKNGTDDVRDTFTFTGGDMTNFSGVNLTSFKVFFSEDDTQNIGTGDFELRSFTTTSAVAPSTDPTITSATYDAFTGNLVVTGTNYAATGGAANDVIANKITITGEGGATYTLTDTANVEISSATGFTLALSATDKAALNQIINNNSTASTGGTTYDIDGAAGFIASFGAIADTGVNGVTVSNVNDPAITSAAYNYNTNVLTVTGTNFVHKNAAGADDVDVSLLTLTGEGGASYTITSATDVEITSGTSFSVTLSGAGVLGVEALLNKDGTNSATNNTLYNLAAADNWMAGAISANDIADATSGVTVSNYAVPTVDGATYDYATGVLVVTGTNFVNNAGANNDVDISKLVFTGEGGVQYQLTSASDVEVTSDTSYTVTLSGADLTNVEGLLNATGTTAATSATTFSLASTEDWMTGSPAANNVADAAATITVSNYAAPAITAATYDYSTNTLVVTGTNFVTQQGATNDVALSTLTLTGEGGTTYTLTGSNVDIDSATQFTATLSGADIVNVESLLNKDGTNSATANTLYNLAAADNWMVQSPAAADIAIATSGVTVSNYAVPTITSATYDFSTGSLVFTGTNLVAASGANNDIDVSRFTFTGDGDATYTLTDSADVDVTSATSFTVTLSATDRLAIGGLLNKDGAASDGGTIYNINAAEDWAAGAPAANTVVDATGNEVTVSNYAIPAITAAAYDYNSNVLTVTGTNFVNEVGASNDVDISTLTFTGEGGATYALTSTSDIEVTSATSFAVTLSGADLYNVEALLNKDGLTAATAGTTYNLAAADNWMAGAAATTDIADATNAITVSNYAAPAISNATYDVSTGQLVVTGTNFVNQSGATNDIDASLLTIAGQDGSYTLTDTADVEITSATAFTLTLSATDQLNIHGVLDRNGVTSSGAITYNIAAADNWMTGSPAATDIADATLNAVTVSNVATPTVSSATYDSDTGIVTVTGTNLFKKIGATNDIDLSTLTFTGGTGDATYAITTATDVEITSATSFSFTLSGTDKTNVDALLDQVGATSSGGSTYNLAAADNWLTGADSATDIADATNAVTVAVNPHITSATYDATSGVLVVTGTNIQANGGGADIDASKLTLTGEGGVTYTLTDTADVERDSISQFTLTLSATDKAALNQIMNKAGLSSTGGTVFNVAAADDWDTNVTAGDTSDTTGNAVTVSNVPVPTIAATGTTYDASTGVLTLAGTGFLKRDGATNDIDVSLFTFTGEGGLTYTLTDSSDVEITSATAATVTLSATDKEQVNRLVNKNGTAGTSGTTYNLAAAEDWAAGADAAVNVVDATGNGITASNVGVPSITSSTYNATTGALVVTGTNFTSFGNGGTNDIDVSKFTFAGEGGATYALTDTSDVEITSTTSFTVTLSATDSAAVNQIMNKAGASSTGGSTYNLAAAEDWAAGADAAVNVVDATGNGVTVSSVAVPAITSSTYDASTGALVVTGTGFLKRSGATNDIDVSRFTVTGEGGATYTLTSATDVEITSGTAFTITLSAADKLGVNSLLNKNLTASDGGTTYNLAAAEDWAAGADTAVNVVDATGNGITVSNVQAPAITSATYDASTNQLAVTGTNFVNKAGASNDVDVSTLTLTGEGAASYTLTSASDVEITSASAFTVTLSGADLLAVEGLLNKNLTASDDGTTYNLAAADNWMTGAAASTDIADTTGNGVTVSNYTAPAIVSSAYDISTGILTVTGTNFVSKTGAANDVDVSAFTFTGEGAASYTLTSASDVEVASATAFTITLSGADKLAVDGLLNKNLTASDGGTTYNLAAADNWMTAAAPTANIADATNGVTASNYAAPTITSASLNSSTGVLTVTGTGFVSKPGAANDVDLSTLTFTGKAGATYTLTTATDVEVTSGTGFSATLSGTDLTSVKALLDKNGTSASDATAYNLAGADNWMAAAAATADIADASNGLTVTGIPAAAPGTGTGLNITQTQRSGGANPNLPAPSAAPGVGGIDTSVPPTVPPIPTLSTPGQPPGPGDNTAENNGRFTSSDNLVDPGGIDASAIVGNVVGGRSNLVDSFYGAGRITAPGGGGNDGGGGGGGSNGGGGNGGTSSLGGNDVSSLVGNSVINNISGLGGQGFGFGGPGFGFGGNFGGGLFEEGESGTDTPGLGASMQPSGRPGFGDQLAQASRASASDMSRLAAALAEAVV